MNDELIARLISDKLNEGQHYTTVYLTSFSVYVTITGALLKVTIDAHRRGDPYGVSRFCVAGIMASSTYLLACGFQQVVAYQLADDLAALNSQLGSPLRPSQMEILWFISVVAGIFTLFTLLGWLWLLWDMREQAQQARSHNKNPSPPKNEAHERIVSAAGHTSVSHPAWRGQT